MLVLLRQVLLIVLSFLGILVVNLRKEVKGLFYNCTLIDLKLFAMVFFSNVAEDLVFKNIHSFCKLISVLQINVSQNVQEMHIACILVSFDHSIFYHRGFLNSNMNNHVLLSEDLDWEKSIKRNRSNIERPSVSIFCHASNSIFWIEVATC